MGLVKEFRKKGAPAFGIKIADFLTYAKGVKGRFKDKYIIEVGIPASKIRNLKLWKKERKPPIDIRWFFLLGALVYPFFAIGLYLFYGLFFLFYFVYAPFAHFYEETKGDGIKGMVYPFVTGLIYTFGWVSLLNLVFNWF